MPQGQSNGESRRAAAFNWFQDIQVTAVVVGTAPVRCAQTVKALHCHLASDPP